MKPRCYICVEPVDTTGTGAVRLGKTWTHDCCLSFAKARLAGDERATGLEWRLTPQRLASIERLLSSETL